MLFIQLIFLLMALTVPDFIPEAAIGGFRPVFLTCTHITHLLLLRLLYYSTGMIFYACLKKVNAC
jgi:hypothetical protein